MQRAKHKPNVRWVYWLSAGVLLFAVLAMTYILVLAHFGFGAAIMGPVTITAISTIIVLSLLALTVILLIR